MTIDKTTAILSLKPGASFSVYGNDRIEWNSPDITQPTEEEVVRKLAELKYMDEINQYQRDRLAAYPSAGDQFDRIFHDGVEAWKSDIQGIKNVYPRKYPDPVELKTRQDKAVEDLKSS